MSILKRLAAAFAPDEPERRAPGPITAIETSGWRYTLEPHEHEGGRGYVVHRDGERMRWDRLYANDPDLYAFSVAGVKRRLDALQDDSFAPGRRVTLSPEPENPYDPDAIAVWDAGASLHVGYVPRGETAAVRALGLGDGGGVVLWEHRADGRRVAVRVLAFSGAAYRA